METSQRTPIRSVIAAGRDATRLAAAGHAIPLREVTAAWAAGDGTDRTVLVP